MTQYRSFPQTPPIAFPAMLRGTPPIVIGAAQANQSQQQNLEPETLQVIGFSPIPVTPTAAFLLNNAILTWKSLGMTGAALQVRVGELQQRISGGYALWSQFGVSPFNADNSAALNALPTGILILADTPGTLNITNTLNLQSNLWIVSDWTNIIQYTLPVIPANFFMGVLGQSSLGGTAPFTTLNNIYLFGLNFVCSNVNTQLYSVLVFQANNTKILHMSATNYASLCLFVGANVELAYWNCQTIGDTNAGPAGGPGIRMQGNAPNGGALFVPSNPAWPVVPGSTHPASVWVHDNSIQGYDSIYQISPSSAGAPHNWGSGLDSIDVLMENSTLLVQTAPPTVGATGTMLLIGTGAAATGFSYNITNACFRNLTGNTASFAFVLENENNPGKTWSNLQILNCTVDCSTVAGTQTCIRVTCAPAALAAGSINGLTIDSCHFTSPKRGDFEFVGDPATVLMSNVTLSNCTFATSTTTSTVVAAGWLHGFGSNASIINNTISTRKNGIEIGGSSLSTPGGDTATSQWNNVTVTGNTINSVTTGGIGILLENTNNSNVQNNSVNKSGTGTFTGAQTTAPVVSPAQPGTTNSTISNNNLHAMPVVDNAGAGHGNTISGNT